MQYAHRFRIDRPTVMPMEVSPKSFSRYFINVEWRRPHMSVYCISARSGKINYTPVVLNIISTM
jgi:hypothetical protein